MLRIVKWTVLGTVIILTALFLACSDDDNGLNPDDDSDFELFFDMTTFNNQLIAAGEIMGFSNADQPLLQSWNGSAWTDIAPGLDSIVYRMVAFNNNLYVTGSFTTIGGVAANDMAYWDGSTWHAMGTGIEGYAYAMTIFNGWLVIGGAFTSVNGVTAHNIAAWYGGAWHAIGPGVPFTVFSLTTSAGNLVAGGVDNGQGHYSAFNGVDWLAPKDEPNGSIDAMTVYANNLVIGGTFDSIAGGQMFSIATYNSGWQGFGAGLSYNGTDWGWVFDFEIFNSELVAAGQFNRAGTVNTSNIAHWNGTAWQAFGSGIAGHVNTVTIFDGQLWAAGGFIVNGQDRSVARWTGSAWDFIR
ncbi:MAG: hypothetical protein PVH24_02805 [Candidatus Zixiibacteriota bacterium]|jgi:hypothetical protein